MDNFLSGVHSYFTYFYRRWSLDVQISTMTQSKYCINPCRLNSTELIWKQLRSHWAAEEMEICPEVCRWSRLSQDCTLDYSYHVEHNEWQPVNTLHTSVNWEEVWFNVLWRRGKRLHLIRSREEKFTPKKILAEKVPIQIFSVESRFFFPWQKKE